MSDKGDFNQYENVQGPSKRRGCVNHCKRFWWAWLLGVVAIIVLVVCLVIFVAIPKIAQQKIDAAQLSIQGIIVSNTQSENYTMSINSTITTDGSVHATIDSFSGVMYLEDLPPQTPFATVLFPQSTSAALQLVNVTDQFTPITDMAAFTTFNTWLLDNDTLRVTVKGDTWVHISGLSKAYPVTFQKTITMPGLSKFNGTTVLNPNISIAGFPDGTNFRGTSVIPNRSLVTFDIGNATFHNYLNGSDIGTVYLDNVTLSPGLNNVTMRANIAQLPVLQAIGNEPYCKTGVLPFELQGKSVVNHGQPLSYFADALAAANQTVPIDLTAPLQAINITVKCNS